MKTEPATAAPSSGRPRRLRVCHVAYTFYEEDNRVTRYARAFADRGHDVDVIALRRPGQPKCGDRAGVRVSRIQQRVVTERSSWQYLAKILLFLARSAALVAARHLRRRYDVVHVHNVPDFLVFAALVPRLAGTPVILDIHDMLPEMYAGKFRVGPESTVFSFLRWVERLSCGFASHVIIANDIWRAKLVERAVAASKCTTVLNYPDLRLFTPAPRQAAQDDSKFIMLYPGSLNRYQGLQVAIDAIARLRDRLPGAELHIYGEGAARDDLRARAARLGLQNRVCFHDPVPLEDVARIMAGADVGVEPKLAEGFSGDAVSTKILEFMACGVPVIASRTAAHAYYFNDSVLRFFPPGDADALAKALEEYHAVRGRQADLIQRAKTFAEGYGWQRRVDDYIALVNGLIDASPRGTPAGDAPAEEE